jgi:hypothetical protein
VQSTSILSDWDVSLKAKDESVCSVSWKHLYRASLFGFGGDAFHQACVGAGKHVVVVKAENGRIAAAYNEDGFSGDHGSSSSNRNGFIVSINEYGSFGARFDQTALAEGVYNFSNNGPAFNFDLAISSNCHEYESSYSKLGCAYGNAEVNESALFGQKFFQNFLVYFFRRK